MLQAFLAAFPRDTSAFTRVDCTCRHAVDKLDQTTTHEIRGTISWFCLNLISHSFNPTNCILANIF